MWNILLLSDMYYTNIERSYTKYMMSFAPLEIRSVQPAQGSAQCGIRRNRCGLKKSEMTHTGPVLS